MFKWVEDCSDPIKVVTCFICNDLFLCNDLFSFRGFAKVRHITSAIIACLSNPTARFLIRSMSIRNTKLKLGNK